MKVAPLPGPVGRIRRGGRSISPERLIRKAITTATFTRPKGQRYPRGESSSGFPVPSHPPETGAPKMQAMKARALQGARPENDPTWGSHPNPPGDWPAEFVEEELAEIEERCWITRPNLFRHSSSDPAERPMPDVLIGMALEEDLGQVG